MPNIKSQKKRVITNEKSNLRNRAIKSELKTELKKAQASLETASDRQTVVAQAMSSIDKAVKAGALKKNTANRKKAAFSKVAQ